MSSHLAPVQLFLCNIEAFVSVRFSQSRTSLPQHPLTAGAAQLWCLPCPNPRWLSGIRTDCTGCFGGETGKAQPPRGLRKDSEASIGGCACQPSTRHRGGSGWKPRSRPRAQVPRPPAYHVPLPGSHLAVSNIALPTA